MKSLFFEIFMPFILFEVLLPSSASPLFKFNCNENCTAILNTFITHSVQKDEVIEKWESQSKRLSGELAEIGWTVIQRRFDGSENFDRSWQDYENGFGDKKGEFFLGLRNIYYMTCAIPHELYIKLEMVNGSTSYALYSDFQIESAKEKYQLKSLGTYYGTAGDSLGGHVHQRFTTFDRDNDDNAYFNCAMNEFGGWWFGNCAYSSLNGKFYAEGISSASNGIYWGSWHNYSNDSLTFVEMMIRPKTYFDTRNLLHLNKRERYSQVPRLSNTRFSA